MISKQMAAFFLGLSLLATSFFAQAGIVKIQNSQLTVDGEIQPQLFGAELQYFRLRGGYGPNLPRAKVMSLWGQALDRLKEAKMNAISFYIPWDFHEYAPGKFDFDGTVDEDGDGNPDYPSRDVKTFFKMIEARGIRHIMVRPGPYINAEWGFLGFGAIPLWFHQEYPESHMQNPEGYTTKLYDYHNADLLRHTELWFRAVYEQVLKEKIGPGRPISFLQLDNETNYMWQSLYNHDFSPVNVDRYRQFLKNRYSSLTVLNEVHNRQWKSFEEVLPPVLAGLNVAEDQDWYRYEDESVFLYLEKIRRIWEKLGVHEPDVLFTLAESYNATQHGLLPNYQWHNQKDRTGLFTVNLYPKTYETREQPLFNLPFKTDHDVKAAESASQWYFGGKEQWALGPEIQTGWWRGITVSPEARQQTYLSVIGHGLKAFFVYYFNEGDNWDSDWGYLQVQKIYDELKKDNRFADLTKEQLPAEFWKGLQEMTDRQLMAGFDVKHMLLLGDSDLKNQLYFDAPLDGEAQPRKHFDQLKNLGEKLIAPFGDWLSKASEVTDPVCLLKDVAQHVPSSLQAIDSVQMNSDWSSALIGYTLHAGVNPKILHWGIHSAEDLKSCRLILRQDQGLTPSMMAQALREFANQGGLVVNFLGDSLAREMGLQISQAQGPNNSGAVRLNFEGASFEAASSPLMHYQLAESSSCQAILFHESAVSGYRCSFGKGSLIQIGALFHDVYNSNRYVYLGDLVQRETLLRSWLQELGIEPTLQFADRSAKFVAFARKQANDERLWITVKSAQLSPSQGFLRVQGLHPNGRYEIKALLSGKTQTLLGSEIQKSGFSVSLPTQGSDVYWLTPASTRSAR
ncbi:MAG: beta-galactosidase [Pseudobdellovibrionaceae bacterium]